ncbi:MAG: glycosyltransferase [Clostridiales Family XIII bacterium]|jgi:glycosyltransferase involved in cell wall biosynthesis|nr:glycosyltransferase [Clostridiales Family XIII bacterium]
MANNHTFVICAYKESKFLDDTTSRLIGQTTPSRVIISTSTPNETISRVAQKYGLEVRINPLGGTSARDWNFAYAQAETDYVTLAHQDDVYEPSFAEKTLSALESCKDPVLAYTDYYEIRYAEADGEGVRTDSNRILRYKRLMLRTIARAPGNRWLRNRVLSLGYPMNCPGTTYVKRRFDSVDFIPNWHNSHDWEAAIRLAGECGDFLYIPDLLLGHRIYAASQTTNTIGSGIRRAEDFACFRRYWPEPIAKAILKQYVKAYDSNKL